MHKSIKTLPVIIATVVAATLFCCCNSKRYTDIHSLFIAGDDLYAAGSVCDGSSTTDIPTLWKNGVAQEIGMQGNFNKAKSVFVSGTDVYVAIKDDDNATIWKNGERQKLGNGEANCVFVDESQNVYVAGQHDGKPTLWKNGEPRTLGEKGEAKYVVAKGDSVYVVGFFGDYFENSDAFMCIFTNDGKTDTTLYLGMSKANSIFIAKNGDVYVAGIKGGAALWRNGEVEELWDIYSDSGESVAVNDNGKVVVAGIVFNAELKSTAAVWVDGICHHADNIMSYQAMSVVTDGTVFYIGGCSDDGKWSVWEYDGKSEFDIDKLKRVPTKE